MSLSNIYPYIDYDIFINARQKPIGFHLALRSDDHSSPALKEPGFSGHLNKWLPLVLLVSCSINATNIDTHNATVSAHETTSIIDHSDSIQYVYLPQEIKHAIFEAKNELPTWSNKYPEFYTAKEEHNAGIYDVIKNMIEELLTELPQEHTKRSVIDAYYQGIEKQQFMLEQAPTQIAEITTQGMPTRYKRYKQFGSILVHLLEVTGEARFHGDTTFHNVGILGTVSIDKDVRMHGNQTIDGNLTVGQNLNVEGDAGFAGNVAITHDLAVGGNQTIGGDLTIANNLVVNGVPITGTPSVINIGTGQGTLVASSTSTDVAIKTIKAGPNVTITNNADDVTITATLTGGAVSGPASSTDQALVRFDGTSGSVIQNSGIILDDTNNISGVANLTATGTITAPNFNGNAATATTATSFSGTLAGDVTGTQSATVVSSVGGTTAANIAAGSNRANAGTSSDVANTLVARDINGNFSAGDITANLLGNATTATSAGTATTATTATNFSGSLTGDVTGTQNATVVSTVGGISAANVATGAIRANAGTDLNTPSTLVARDGSGNFSAGTITASLAGNATTATTAANATNAATAINFSGSLAGDVTGTQAATVVATVGGVTAANVASGATRANAGTSNNIASTLVARDINGNFSASTITATAITGLNAPVNASDATNKQYVDNAIQGLTTKSPAVALASTNVAITGVATIDGVSLVAGNRVLLTGQTNGIQNGLWVVQTGAWVRPADFANGSSAANAFAFVQQGTTYADTGWVCTNNTGSDIVGNDALNWAQFSSAGQISGQNLDGSNLNNIYTTKSGNNLLFRGLLAGANVTLTPAANNITIGLGSNVVTAPTGTANAVALFSGTGSALTQSAAPITIDASNNIAGLNAITATGNLNLANTTTTTTGVITKGSTRFIHNFGTNNTFAGLTAGNFTLSGNNNTALGSSALTALTSGANNIAIGNTAGSTLTTGSNDIYIGAAAGSVTEASTIRIGTAGTQTQTFIAGINGASSLTNGVPVYIDSVTGQLSTAASAAGVTSSIGNGTANAIAVFTGTGVAIKQSAAPILIDASNNLTGVNTIKATNGTVTVPAYSFTSSPTTGIWSSAANTLDLATNGVNIIDINSTGSVSIQGSTAGSALTVTSSANVATPIAAITSSNNRIGLQINGNGTGSALALTPASAGVGITMGATTGNAIAVNTNAFTVNGTSGNISTNGNLNLVTSTSTAGNITKNGTLFIHNISSTDSFYAGLGAGNTLGFGTANTGVGGTALASCTSGAANVAVGTRSLGLLTNGTTNVAIGRDTLANITTESNNIGIGDSSGSTATGSNNTYIGTVGGVSGTNNIFINSSTPSSISSSNNLFIGYRDSNPGDNGTIRIGSAVNTNCYITAISGKTSASGVPVLINSTGLLGTATSSIRYKENVKDIGEISAKISSLRPVRFNYKKEYGTNEIQYGLIAEEVAKVYPELVVYDDKKQPETVKYHLFDALLINEIQKIMKRNKAVEDRTAKLEEENKKHIELINKLLKRIDQLATQK